jgi:hypothetical protein
VKFQQVNGNVNTIVSEQSIEKKETAYFEVEIDDNPRGADITIGFCYNQE